MENVERVKKDARNSRLCDVKDESKQFVVRQSFIKNSSSCLNLVSDDRWVSVRRDETKSNR